MLGGFTNLPQLELKDIDIGKPSGEGLVDCGPQVTYGLVVCNFNRKGVLRLVIRYPAV